MVALSLQPALFERQTLCESACFVGWPEDNVEFVIFGENIRDFWWLDQVMNKITTTNDEALIPKRHRVESLRNFSFKVKTVAHEQ